MRDMFDNMYTVRIADSGDVAGFPRSHDGLENAITLASREGTEVTFDGEVVWGRMRRLRCAGASSTSLAQLVSARKSLITRDLRPGGLRRP